MYTLHPYQREATDAAIDWVKRSIEPCLIEAATGAGKSYIIAEIARILNGLSGKSILCLAPSGELVTQNREKYLQTGEPASMYSASVGAKCLRHPVVFATPGTFLKVARRMGDKFCAVVLDECHRITPTVQKIIDSMRESNPNLRVIGLSATPYRLGEGYIYRMDENGRTHGPDSARDPYFAKRVYCIEAHALLAMGYLTRPIIAERGASGYETAHLELNPMGKYDAAEYDKAFVGHGRKTAAIVADVLARSVGRRGIMFFAATVQHAQEIMASLHPDMAALVTGTTPKNQRKSIIDRFKAQQLRYLVSVGALTTGFDAPHVDVIAILRLTESVSLLQQIIGRGLRLFDGKDDVLVFDYAENLDRHCPDGDIFNPRIKASKAPGEAGMLEVGCPDCGTKLEFKLRPNEGCFEIDENGYYTLEGERVTTEHGPTPAHYGRRCYGLFSGGGGRLIQCGYRWTSKPCLECAADNDIAARYCSECKAEIINPNDKLVMEFKKLKRDPTQTQTDEVRLMQTLESLSRAGNPTLRVDFETEYRNFSVWYRTDMQNREYRNFMDCTAGGRTPPKTITYRKDPDSRFYRVLAYGLPSDSEILNNKTAQ